jgi:TatD DNase family protein
VDIAIRPVELPDLGAPVADTHAHLVMLDDPAGALERAAMARVSYIGAIVDATESPEGTFHNLATWLEEAGARLADWAVGASAPEVRIVLGTHPHNAKDHTPEVEADVAGWAEDPRVGAIGEIGLDYHYDHSPRGDQRRAFRSQVALAKRLGLPVVVHLREAHDEGYAILEEEGLPEAGCILHCFTEGPETAERFLALGCHISFAGPITFAKADPMREAVKVVPLDRLLAETDCPFLAPAPYRGRTNEPAWVTLVAAKLAEIRGEDPAELASSVVANARRLFGPSA